MCRSSLKKTGDTLFPASSLACSCPSDICQRPLYYIFGPPLRLAPSIFIFSSSRFPRDNVNFSKKNLGFHKVGHHHDRAAAFTAIAMYINGFVPAAGREQHFPIFFCLPRQYRYAHILIHGTRETALSPALPGQSVFQELDPPLDILRAWRRVVRGGQAKDINVALATYLLRCHVELPWFAQSNDCRDAIELLKGVEISRRAWQTAKDNARLNEIVSEWPCPQQEPHHVLRQV